MSPAFRALIAGLLGASLIAVGAAAGGMDGLDLRIGQALFERAWVIPPASTKADDGLGPLFDARSCASCHPRDGRSVVSIGKDGVIEGRGPVLVLGRHDGSGDPVYGRRLQIDAAPGLTPEGVLAVKDTRLEDGRIARMPAPTHLGYGPLAPDTGLSLRAAPDLRGRGLIEQVPEAAVAAIAQSQPEALRGRIRHVALPDGGIAMGRYGWKAAQPSLEGQISEAFFLDMGLSTRLHPEPWGDCTEVQTACREPPQGIEAEGEVEIADAILARVVAYVASLRPPATAESKAGARLFASTGCAQCHRPDLPTQNGGTARLFTDLLLHDLGPGLADTLEAPDAHAAEWRTAPLAGLADALARKTGLLHDGRARTVEEAIAWHGGQAETVRRTFFNLPARDRAALVAYVSGL